MLTRILLSFFAIAAAAAIADTEVSPDWSKCSVSTTKSTVQFRQEKQFVAFIAVKPKELVDKLKCQIKNGRLEVDTRDVFNHSDKASVVFRLRGWNAKPEYLLKNYYLDMNIASIPGGLNATMYFEGNTGSNKKHYWKAKKFIAEKTPSVINFKQVLPENLNQLTLRCDLKQAGIYSLGKITFGQVKEAPVDAGKNHIVNGGAERGWYNTGTVGKKIMSMADDGLIYDGYGKIYHKESSISIDKIVKHSGRSAFKISSDKDSSGRFAFNAVPFVPGKPATFAVWIKAAKPKTRVSMSMFLASGLAYVKYITVGTGWKQYIMTIPVWGENVKGINRIGDTVSGAGAIHRMMTPLIYVTDGTIWFDDATYQLSAKPIPVAISDLSVSGVLTNPTGYYFPGQKINAKLELISNKDITVPVSWEAYDFFGKEICKGNGGSITLKANKPQILDYELKLPPQQRGAMNWKFTIGKAIHNFYFGVIDESGPRSQRLGINFTSRQNVEVAIRILKDFGFGSVRQWSAFRRLPFHGFRDIPAFKKNEFYVMMCISGLKPEAPSCLVPVELTRWKQLIKDVTGKYKGQVDCYEILNESNIWNGRTKNPDIAKYREMTPKVNVEVIKAAAEAIHSTDPNVKIAGPTSCHTDVNWTASILRNGAAKYLDIITEHPYRERPELPDYAEDINKMHKLLKPYRDNYPIIASEAGERSTAMPPDNLILDCMRSRSAYNVRMMLTGLANGLEQYHHFCLNMGEVGTGWAMILAGNPDSDNLPRPAPVMFALRALVDLIGDAKPNGRVKLGNSYRCYIFDKGTSRVAAIWKWHGAPAGLHIPADKEIKAYDLMGTPVHLEKLTINEFPLYLQSKLPSDQLGKLIASGITASETFPLAATLVIKGRNSFAVKLANLSGKHVSGQIKVLEQGVVRGSPTVNFPAIAAESTGMVTFTTGKAIGSSNMPVKLQIIVNGGKAKEIEFNLRSILVPHVTKELKIDGDLSDWPATIKPLILNSNDAVKLKGWTAADNKLKAEIRLAWDDEYLYVSVYDNKTSYVENPRSSTSLWRGDGLQIAYDPLHNATTSTIGYQDDDYEFSIGKFKGKPLVYMHNAAAATYDSLDKPVGFVPGVKRAIRTTSEGTVYELAFPRLLVSPFRLEPDSSMRFNLILNINNGKDRVGWIELAPGIGQSPKRPGPFMDIVLTK